MGVVRVVAPGGAELQGHLIEERAYARVRDVAEALGYRVDWQPPNLVVISEIPRPVGPDTDLRLPSGVSPDLLDKYLVGSPLAGLGKDFLAAEGRWRVNAVFVCSVACHESGFATSPIAADKRNLFGFMAYDATPYESARSYATFADSIEDFCRLISREYLNPAGCYHNGPTVPGIGKRYATDPGWADKVLQHCQAVLAGGDKAI